MSRSFFVLVSSFVAIAALCFSGTAAATLLPADAGDPAIQDLQYDSATGEVLLDIDGATGFTGYVLKSAGGFIGTPGSHVPFMSGVFVSLPDEIAEASFGGWPGPWPKSIGFIFPTGMSLAGLSTFLTTSTAYGELGAPLVPFDLVVLNPPPPGVPEPATFAMAAVGLLGLGLYGWRRNRT